MAPQRAAAEGATALASVAAEFEQLAYEAALRSLDKQKRLLES